MFLKSILAKPSFIAFYKDENRYKVLHEQYKKNRLIFSVSKEFESKKELRNYILTVEEDNPQTYVSTFIASPNQGVVPSCDKNVYKQMEIETENIKTVCINKKYSFYTTIYELMELKKSYPFLDLLFPALAVLDYKSSLRHNSLYILTTKEYSYILIYKNHLPVFSDIFEVEDDILDDSQEIEDITDMDIVEDFDESLDNDIENVEEIDESPDDIETLNVEYKIIEHIKHSLKDYYENDGDFIEKIYIFDTIGIQKNITEMINDEIFIENSLEKIDILKILNELSRKNV